MDDSTRNLLIGLLVLIGIVAIIAYVLRVVITSGVKMANRKDMTGGVRVTSLSYEDHKAPAIPTALDACQNCGNPIGKLETPHVWKDHIVCGACHHKLSSPV